MVFKITQKTRSHDSVSQKMLCLGVVLVLSIASTIGCSRSIFPSQGNLLNGSSLSDFNGPSEQLVKRSRAGSILSSRNSSQHLRGSSEENGRKPQTSRIAAQTPQFEANPEAFDLPGERFPEDDSVSADQASQKRSRRNQLSFYPAKRDKSDVDSDPLGIRVGSPTYLKKQREQRKRAEAKRLANTDSNSYDEKPTANYSSPLLASDYSDGRELDVRHSSGETENPLRRASSPELKRSPARNTSNPETLLTHRSAPTAPKKASPQELEIQNLRKQVEGLRNQLQKNSPGGNEAFKEFLASMRNQNGVSGSSNEILAAQIRNLANSGGFNNSPSLQNGMLGMQQPNLDQFGQVLQNVTANYKKNGFGVQPAAFGNERTVGSKIEQMGNTNPTSSVSRTQYKQPNYQPEDRSRYQDELEAGRGGETNWKQSLMQTIDNVRGRLAGELSSAERLQLETNLRLLHLIANQQEAAMQSIESIPPELRDYWSSQIFSLSQIMQSDLDGSQATFINHRIKANRALPELNKAMQSLSNVARLKVKNPQFCTAVHSFGNYEASNSVAFAPGQEMIVYSELENYFVKTSSGVKGKLFETVVQPSWMILNESGNVVKEYNYKEIVDKCKSRRKDFHIILKMFFPQLPKGRYQLVVTVQDRHGNKEGASAPMAFSIR